MKPEDQLIKEIEKHKRSLHDDIEDYSKHWNNAIDEAISTIKEFLKGYTLVKKGDLLTEEEAEWVLGLIKGLKGMGSMRRKLKALDSEEGKVDD